MKTIKTITLTLLAMFIATVPALAQPGGGQGGGGSTTAPVDGGAIFFFVAITVYGYYRLKQNEKQPALVKVNS